MVGFAVVAGLVGVGLVAGFSAAEPEIYDIVGYLADLFG
jgi:hypothetical protein